jgi:flagellar hook-associated protein 2
LSSPITFSGFNNIDFNMVLTSLMQQASQPLTLLESRQKALESQVKTFDTLKGRLVALETAADRLGDMSSVSTMQATATDETAVSVSASSGATAGHYDIVVTELARAQVTASTSTTPDATTTVVATGGSLVINGVTVSVAGDTTLQQLADAINDTDGIGVTAAVIRTGTTTYRLALTSTNTGTANAFTITSTLSGGGGVSFGDFNGNGVSGDSAEDNAVSASDAAILVNNIAATHDSNTFEEVVPGLTVTVLKKDAGATIGIDVTPDATALEDRVRDFVTAYNDLIKFLDAQRSAASSGDEASIGREPLLRQLRNGLRVELAGAHGTGSVTRLAEVGIEFTQSGTIELDETALADAVASDGDGVRALLAGTGGVFPAVESLLDEYGSSTGFIATVQERLNAQIDSMDRQVQNMQARLAVQRESLLRQFIEADRIMSRLRDQSGSLASLGSGFGSFS